MKADSVLKGRVALTLVEELLRTAGNAVYPFGDAAAMQSLLSEKAIDRESPQGAKIASMPDFVVVPKRKKPVFVEVKFRTDPESLEEQLLLEKDALEKFWEAKIVIVTPQEPHFRVLTPPYFRKATREGWPIPVFNWKPLEKDLVLGVTENIVQGFNKLVLQHYKA